MKKIIKLVIWAVILFIIANVIFIHWASTGKMTALKQKIFTFIPYPIALVNYQPVSAADFIFKYNLALKYAALNQASFKSQNLQKNTYDTFIQDKINNELANKNGIIIKDSQVNSEFSIMPGQEAASLKLYGLTEKDYKAKVLKPYVVLTQLRIWFNRQQNLNQKTYTELANLQKQIDAGSKFTDFVKFSQDKASRETFGDLGFVESTALLPEILDTIDNMKYNETRIVASREGLHLIELLEKDNNGPGNSARFHVRQIFLPTSGFEQWQANETKKVKIIKIINFS